MKKRINNDDVPAMMNQIQEQLAVMNEKLDSFMTKSLTELAQALAASKPAPRPQVQQPSGPLRPQNDYRSQRQMYAVVCFECGKDAELPFKPKGDRPVYCPECFAKRKGRSAPAPSAPASAPPTMGRGGQLAARTGATSSPGTEDASPTAPIEKSLKKSARKAAKAVRRVVKKKAAKPAAKKGKRK